MKIILRLAVLQVAGMLVSLALALLCSALHDPGTAGWSSAIVDGRPIVRDWFWPTPGPSPDNYSWCNTTGYSIELLTFTPPLAGPPAAVPMALSLSNAVNTQERIRAGLPLPCLETSDHAGPAPPTKFELAGFTFCSLEYGGFLKKPVSAAIAYMVIMPLNPYWPGLVFDGLLYGVGLGSLVFWLAGSRRRRRLARGQCLRCGYTLAGLAKCPECGGEETKAAA